MFALQLGMSLITLWLITAAGLVTYWAVDHTPPTEVLMAAAPEHRVLPGERLAVRWEVTRHKHCAVTRTEFLFDSHARIWMLQQTSLAVQPGPLGKESYTTMTPIPKDMKSGPAKLRIVLQYACNPLNAIWPLRPDVTDIPLEVLG